MSTDEPRVLPGTGPLTASAPRDASSAAALLEVRDLSVTFQSEAGPVTAVRNLSYEVRPARCSASSASPAPASRSPRWP